MDSISRHRFAFTPVSSNAKLGPIPASGTSKDSCPPTCSYRPDKEGGCYAAYGPASWQWAKLDNPDNDKALTLEQLCDRISKLRRGTLWRKNQYGDLPHTDDDLLDVPALEMIVEASRHTDGFTYSHADVWDYSTHDAIRDANKAGGLTINLSAENLLMADHYFDMAIAPVVVALPVIKAGTPVEDIRKPVLTPKGRQITICPTYYDESMTCKDCGICQVSHRKAGVGFYAHGSGAKRVEKVFWAKSAN